MEEGCGCFVVIVGICLLILTCAVADRISDGKLDEMIKDLKNNPPIVEPLEK